MKNLVTITLVLLLSISCEAQSYEALVSRADSLYKVQAYNESNLTYQTAFKINAKDPRDLYNGACSAALANDLETASKLLLLAVERGWKNFDHLQTDRDLEVLHATETWKNLMIKIRHLQEKMELNYNKPVKAQLELVYETDQGVRQQYIAAQRKHGNKHPEVDSLIRLMSHHDSVNVTTVTKILDQFGWLGEENVGNKGNTTLFLVIQHAPLVIQQKYLPMLRQAVKDGKAQPSSLALLEDRVALGEGRKQLYGSQISMNAKLNKKYLAPLLDPDNVDKRRAEVGLGPIAIYLKQWEIVWNVEEYKKQLPEIERWEKGL